MPVTRITSDAQFRSILEKSSEEGSDKLLIVMYFDKWCGPYVQQSPSFLKLSDEHSHFQFCKVEVDDEFKTLAQEQNIEALPTIVIYKGGSQLTRLVGGNTRALESTVVELANQFPDN